MEAISIFLGAACQTIVNNWNSPNPPMLSQWHRHLSDHLQMAKFSESLTQTHSDNYVSKYVRIWFPITRYFSYKNLIPPNILYISELITDLTTH